MQAHLTLLRRLLRPGVADPKSLRRAAHLAGYLRRARLRGLPRGPGVVVSGPAAAAGVRDGLRASPWSRPPCPGKQAAEEEALTDGSIILFH